MKLFRFSRAARVKTTKYNNTWYNEVRTNIKTVRIRICSKNLLPRNISLFLLSGTLCVANNTAHCVVSFPFWGSHSRIKFNTNFSASFSPERKSPCRGGEAPKIVKKENTKFRQCPWGFEPSAGGLKRRLVVGFCTCSVPWTSSSAPASSAGHICTVKVVF